MRVTLSFHKIHVQMQNLSQIFWRLQDYQEVVSTKSFRETQRECLEEKTTGGIFSRSIWMLVWKLQMKLFGADL